ncbi:MAG: ATP-binding protein, partial [Frankia sp.]|nr:ATP-binding protein [Frankia sp.]
MSSDGACGPAVTISLPAVPMASPLARHLVRGLLGAWRLAHAVDVAELLACELVTNAIDAHGLASPDHQAGSGDGTGDTACREAGSHHDATAVRGGERPASEPRAPLAACTVKLRLTGGVDRLIIEVLDDNPRPPVRRAPDIDEEGGRGLLLVEALSRRWGHRAVRRRNGTVGKVVWCEVEIATPTVAGMPRRSPSPAGPRS